MNERGNSRTAGTDWQLMDVNSMWACLQDHDTANHWKQVAGWRKVCDLAQIHLGRLQEYRRGLASAWPPETSAASGTYLAQLDELIEKVRHTHDAAAANYTALSAATQAIGTTRAALRKIYEEYAAKLQQKQAYDATAADPKAIMGSRVTEPPVSDAELERLNVQARGMMFGLSGELQQAQATLQKPPPPPPRPGHQPNDPDTYGASAQGPVIPPVVAVPMAPPISPTKTRNAPSLGPTPAQTPPGLGPVLGGTSSALTPGTTSPISPGSATLPLAPPTAPPGLASGIPVRPIGDLTPQRPGLTGPPTGADNIAHRSSPPASNRPMPPGGLIGSMPGMGLGQPGAANNPPRRINPIGGVIGGGGAGTAPSGGAGSRPGLGRGLSAAQGTPPMGGAPGPASLPGVQSNSLRPNGRGEAGNNASLWDPDHPWETDTGVPPVVRPPEDEGPIDPGPTIGFNR
ncbi:hypothetical protein F8271_16075 [Micromonospora sp. ALFpr18c]|uniref:hypothetical protein n=1 Tax=unclassified Micromonospora TaxID=2617518 RepID=UPI00124B6A28|nr:hypothetical protein [Micromonospora sp. ALFpr18c]KAB1940476.1 hypothetical protein F8271_16075 [Micromonospora sp. ALFpr18c]